MSFKPFFGQLLTAHSGVGQTPPFVLRFADEPCAFWFSTGRGRNPVGPACPAIIGQVAVGIGHGSLDFFGWGPDGLTWKPQMADWWGVVTPDGEPVTVQPVFGAPMWAGTPDAHWRYDVCWGFTAAVNAPLPVQGPQSPFGVPISGGRQVTFDLHRPFNAASPTFSGLAGNLYPDPWYGRATTSSGDIQRWTDILDVSDSVDIRDAALQPATQDILTQAGNGDEIKIPGGTFSSIYTVMLVYRLSDANGMPFKRAFLLRVQPHWPGP